MSCPSSTKVGQLQHWAGLCHLAGRWCLAGRWHLAGLWLAAALGLFFAHEAKAIDLVGSWVHAPYRVKLLLAVDPEARLAPQAVESLAAGLQTELANQIGAAWQSEVALGSWPAVAELSQVADGGPYDKVFLLRVARQGGGWQLSAQEFDALTAGLGPVVRQSAVQPELLAAGLLDLTAQAFRPLAKIELVEGAAVGLRPRAAAIAPRTIAVGQLVPAMVMQPAIVYLDPYGAVRRVEQTPWSFLQLETAGEAAGSLVPSRLYTGLRNPLTARRRGRVEPLALAALPTQSQTMLQLQSREASDKPLVGYEVFYTRPGETQTHWLGRSDWQGRVAVMAEPHEPLKVLYVKHGSEVIARLPLVAGMVAEAMVRLPDDDARLEVEGLVLGVQQRLVDGVARQQALLLRLQGLVAEGQLTEARRLLVEAREAVPVETAVALLAQERRRWSGAGQEAPTKILRLFDETEALCRRLATSAALAEAESLLRTQEAQPAGGGSPAASEQP